MFGRAPKKSFFSFNESHHSRITPNRPNMGDIMMHDVNIKVKGKMSNF